MEKLGCTEGPGEELPLRVVLDAGGSGAGQGLGHNLIDVIENLGRSS